MARMRSAPVLLAALAAAALLGGCGAATDDQASDAPSSTAASATTSTTTSATATQTPSVSSSDPVTLPTCASVWVDGQQLAMSYRGCLDGDVTVKARKQPCEMGKPLMTYRNSYWAVADGPVHQVSGTLAKDAGWHRALIQCGG